MAEPLHVRWAGLMVRNCVLSIHAVIWRFLSLWFATVSHRSRAGVNMVYLLLKTCRRWVFATNINQQQHRFQDLSWTLRNGLPGLEGFRQEFGTSFSSFLSIGGLILQFIVRDFSGKRFCSHDAGFVQVSLLAVRTTVLDLHNHNTTLINLHFRLF